MQKEETLTPVVAFVGYHNSGKTSFASKVVRILKEKGYKVAVVKSTKHSGLIKDTEGKDTFIYKQSGADAVALVMPDEIVLFSKEQLPLTELVFHYFPHFDIVICEGFKNSSVPKIEVIRKELNKNPLHNQLKNVIAVASDFEIPDIKNFSIEKPEEVAEFLEKSFIKKRNDDFPHEVTLLVNGKEIPMKHYVKKSLMGVIEGFISALKGVEKPETIEIRISKSEEK